MASPLRCFGLFCRSSGEPRSSIWGWRGGYRSLSSVRLGEACRTRLCHMDHPTPHACFARLLFPCLTGMFLALRCVDPVGLWGGGSQTHTNVGLPQDCGSCEFPCHSRASSSDAIRCSQQLRRWWVLLPAGRLGCDSLCLTSCQVLGVGLPYDPFSYGCKKHLIVGLSTLSS